MEWHSVQMDLEWVALQRDRISGDLQSCVTFQDLQLYCWGVDCPQFQFHGEYYHGPSQEGADGGSSQKQLLCCRLHPCNRAGKAWATLAAPFNLR